MLLAAPQIGPLVHAAAEPQRGVSVTPAPTLLHPQGALGAQLEQSDKCPTLLHSQTSPREAGLGPRCGSMAALCLQTVLFSGRGWGKRSSRTSLGGWGFCKG